MKKLNNVEMLPRERILNYGPAALADYELLAIMLRTGTKGVNVLELAKEVLQKIQRINYLNETTIYELTEIKGIKNAKAIEILAAIELGKRVCKPTLHMNYIKSSKDVYKLLEVEMSNISHEEIRCIYLNNKGSVQEIKIISHGGRLQAAIDFREIIKWAFKFSSSNFILVHNHPSGVATPSLEDLEVSKRLDEYATSIGLLMVDHVIIGKGQYYSYRKQIIEYINLS